MKKLLTILLSAVMLSASAVAFVGCTKEDESKKVMNVSCNPSVEFVLDANDKVISVNALNEEGNLIISAQTFVGKDAEEAAQLFVQVSAETGFIVSGRAGDGENQIEISFSGDTKQAEALYNDVKAKVETYLTTENITASIQKAEAITKEKLEALVADCAPYMDQAEIEALEYMELVETLYESRKETVDFYSQEVKNAYYEAKAFVMQQAEVEVLKSKVSMLGQAAVDVAFSVYTRAVESIESTRNSLLIAETSPYQVALNAFREAKVEYLKYRDEVANMEESEVTSFIQTQLESLETALNNAEQTLISAGETANQTLDELKNTAKTAYDAVVSAIEQASVTISDHLTEVSQKQTEAKTQFFNTFETEYANAITSAKNSWTAMKTELENRTQPQE